MLSYSRSIMLDDNENGSPINALVALTPLDHGWQPILRISDQVVLYNPTSHAISIRTHARQPSPGLARRSSRQCPYCHRFLPDDLESEHEVDDELDHDYEEEILQARNRVANYFQLLEIANETASRPLTPTSTPTSGASSSPGASGDASTPNSSSSPGPSAFRAENMAEGYFKAFFKEECKLGMGANGSVFLCQVRAFEINVIMPPSLPAPVQASPGRKPTRFAVFSWTMVCD